jgi:hypothetical protein
MNDNTKDTDRRNLLKDAVDNACAEVEAAVADFNEEMDDAWSEVDNAQSEYNDAVAELQKFLDEHDEDEELEVMVLDEPGAVEIIMCDATADLDREDEEAEEDEA